MAKLKKGKWLVNFAFSFGFIFGSWLKSERQISDDLKKDADHRQKNCKKLSRYNQLFTEGARVVRNKIVFTSF